MGGIHPSRLTTLRFLLALCLAISFGTRAWADEPPPSFLSAWGHQGTGPGEFGSPIDVAPAPDGTVLVSDFTRRIQRFSSSGEILQVWTLPPAGINAVASPAFMVCDDQGYVYVCVESGWIEKATISGTFIAMWRLRQTTSGIVPQTTGIAIGSDGNVFVGDGRKRNVQKFSPDGEFLLLWGSDGSGPGQFRSLDGIAADRGGRIYVACKVGEDAVPKIRVFDLEGNLLFEWGSGGSGPSQFDSHGDIAIDPEGNVYVSDENLDRIQKFTSEGVFLSMWGSNGTSPGQFQVSWGVGTDADGNLFVADIYNHRVQKFGYLPVQSLTTTWGRVKAAHR